MRRFLTYIALLILASCQKNDSWTKVQGGHFQMGNEAGGENEKPEVRIRVESFLLSSTEVSNDMFRVFVDETNYVTDAERNGGLVFNQTWQVMEGVNWKHPYGPESNLDTLGSYPVVFVSYNDAQAYCKWAGVRLPTEQEWEYTAKKGEILEVRKNIGGSHGFMRTMAVDALGKDQLGNYHMAGNVWEWCQDNYNFEVHDKWSAQPEKISAVYSGPSFDPENPRVDSLHVIKGGSFLCQPEHCAGYRPEARQGAQASQGYFHVGFRIAKDTE